MFAKIEGETKKKNRQPLFFKNLRPPASIAQGPAKSPKFGAKFFQIFPKR
jgi:hypothetical protein